jgi:folylpolyglutamate synthase/dihydropteroate synthase
MLARLFSRAHRLYAAPPQSERALDERALASLVDELAGDRRGDASVYPSVSTAVLAASRACGPEDLVLCAGSLVLVGEVRSLVANELGRPEGDSLAQRIIPA